MHDGPTESADQRARRLSRGIAGGSAEALAEFYAEWFDRALAAARSRTGRDESFCLDIVQDAMIRVARSIRAMASAADLERWMLRVVYTTAVDRLRGEARRTTRELSRAPLAAEFRADTGEKLAWLQEELAMLSGPDQRLVADRLEGRTLEESGLRAGIGGHAAHGRVRRVLARLRRAAAEVFGD